ncbi:MAG: hypothetical protein NZL93_01470, partial [Chthoniobacterales bacterium]|nr:hypothetical protein [Chthoniobacterales bacterium]
DSPVSDVIQDQEAFLVLRLKEIEPERQQILEECRERVKSILKQRKADAAERDRANRLRSEVIEANRKGTPFAEAARSKGLEVEEYQQLEPWQTSLDLSSVYARVSAEMNPGETSPIAAGPDGYAFLHLLRRYPLDPEIKKQKEPLLTANALDAKRAILFADWIRHAREKAKLRFYQR